MKQHYNIEWLINSYENGDPLKFLYFWGHTKNQNHCVNNSCFSQWYDSPFTVNGVTYKTSEHWMMAQKAKVFKDYSAYKQIIESKKPGEAKEIGRNVLGFNEDIWNQNRFEIVKIGNIHKFNQNRELGEYLLKTGKRILVEASPVDIIWGVGLSKDNNSINNLYEWRGLNLLGFVLMTVRDFIIEFGYFDSLDQTILPPWEKFPNIEAEDMFWRMGKGEDYIELFSKYFKNLDLKKQTVYRLTFPAPLNWNEFY